jgi:hypothetical protein
LSFLLFMMKPPSPVSSKAICEYSLDLPMWTKITSPSQSSGVLSHICNPNYLGGGDHKNCSFKAMLGKSKTTSEISKLIMVMHSCDLSYVGGHR